MVVAETPYVYGDNDLTEWACWLSNVSFKQSLGSAVVWVSIPQKPVGLRLYPPDPYGELLEAGEMRLNELSLYHCS